MAIKMYPHEVPRNVRWLQDNVSNQGRVFVYTRDDRDAMIAEGRRCAIEGFSWRWNVGRRAWEFMVIL